MYSTSIGVALQTSGMGCLSFIQASMICWDMAGGAWSSAGVIFLASNPQTSENHPSTLSPAGIWCNSCSELSRFLQNFILSIGTPALGYLAAFAISLGRSSLEKSATMKLGLPSGILCECVCMCMMI